MKHEKQTMKTVLKKTRWMALGCLLAGTLLIPISSLGFLADFEAPAYANTAVAGQNGWYSGAGSAMVTNSSNCGAGAQELFVPSPAYAYNVLDGAIEYAENTTWSFRFFRNSDMTCNYNLKAGGNANANKIVWFDFNYLHGIRVFDGATLVDVWSEFATNKIYEATVDIDFSAQTFDVAISNLTDATSSSTLTNLAFNNPATLAEAQANSFTVFINPTDGPLWTDNISVSPQIGLVEFDFEAPKYVAASPWSAIAGQDGWVQYGEGARVISTGMLGAGAQELETVSYGVPYGGSARNFSGADVYTANTTFSFLAGRTDIMTGDVSLMAGGAGFADRIVDVVFNFSSGINVYNGTTLVNVWDEFDINDVYEITVDVDFTAGTFDIEAKNLTDATSSATLTGVSFRNGAVTLAQAQAADGRVYTQANYASLFVDNIAVGSGLSVDFEEPTYSSFSPWTSVAGQDGWVEYNDGANVYSNAPSILAAGSHELGILAGGSAARNFAGTLFSEDTSFRFKLGRTVDMTASVSLMAGGVGIADQIVEGYFHFANGISFYDGSNTLVDVWSEFDSNDVYEVTVDIDFSAQTFNVVASNLTDGTVSPTITGLAFNNPATLAEAQAAPYGRVLVTAAYATLWVDDMVVAGLGGGDTDGDGLPDGWELQYYGHITDNVTSNDIVANGINEALEAYIAGFSPKDSEASFDIVDFSEGAGGFILQWDQVGGRQYATYWSPNLIFGFSLMDEDIVGGAYTDTLHGASSEVFYKLEVEMAP